MIRFLSCVLAFCFTVTAGAADRPEPLRLEFEEQAIVISNVTPSETVVVFAIARDQYQMEAAHVVAHKFLLRDRSGSGRIRFDFKRPFEPRAVWAIVDIATGRYTIVPRGDAATMAIPGDGIPKPKRAMRVRHVNAAEKSRVEIALPAAEVLVVRPGKGAWMSLVFDGGTDDDDQRPNGVVVSAAEKLKRLKTKDASTLDRIRKKDVVIAIDPLTLTWFSSDEMGE